MASESNLKLTSDGAQGHITITPLSTAPTDPVTNAIYIDDGTNTANSAVGFRFWNGATWADLSVPSGVVSPDQLILNDGSELTIATAAITVTHARHTVDTEADSASDDLETISGTVAGETFILSANNTARTVVLKNGTDNIICATGADITLDETYKAVLCVSDGTNVTAYPIFGGSGGGSSLTIEEVDGTPSVSSVDTIVFPNGSVTDDGGGQVTVALSATDSNAIHDNVASEISVITEKVSPASGDFILIEDSADSNNKKRVQVGNLPTGSGMASFDLDADTGTAETVTDGNTVTISGGTGIDTSVGATDTVTVAIDSTVATLTGSQTLTNKTLTTPTIGDLTNATHDHSNSAGGGTLPASSIGSGTLAHERGGLETDVSAYDGLVKISAGATSAVTAPSGAIVGISDAQTLTNKTIDADNNTVSNIGSAEIKSEIITGLTADASPVGSTDYVMTYDASATGLKKVLLEDLPGGGGGSGLYTSLAILSDTKSSGTAGGSASATTWNARDLNTEDSDLDNIVTISANKFTIASGSYKISAIAPAYLVVGNKLRLYNVTTSTVVLVGVSSSTNSSTVVSYATLDGVFTSNGTDEYRIDHYTANASATSGLGAANAVAGVIEKYLVITLEGLS